MDPAVGSLSTGLVSGIGNLGLGIGNLIQQSDSNKRNLQFQKDVFNYQKQLQREIFQREDSAIQRRASDIASAGGNPAMAWETGSGAQAGNIVGVDTPQEGKLDYGNLISSSLGQISGGIEQFMQFKTADAQIKRMEADTSLVKAEVITEGIRQKQIQMETAKTAQEKSKLKAEIDSLNYTLDYSINHNLRPGDNNSSIYNSAKDMLSEILSVIPDSFDNFDDNTLLGVVKDIGLAVIPGFAGLKIANLGRKGIIAALKFLKKNKGINNLQDFYGTYYRLTGKAPSKHEVELFKQGITQQVEYKGNSKSYYYRKYNTDRGR